MKSLYFNLFFITLLRKQTRCRLGIEMNSAGSNGADGTNVIFKYLEGLLT